MQTGEVTSNLQFTNRMGSHPICKTFVQNKTKQIYWSKQEKLGYKQNNTKMVKQAKDGLKNSLSNTFAKNFLMLTCISYFFKNLKNILSIRIHLRNIFLESFFLKYKIYISKNIF